MSPATQQDLDVAEFTLSPAFWWLGCAVLLLCLLFILTSQGKQ
jgi:bacteriorhodopsin